MKLIKLIVAMTVALAVDVGLAGDSAPFRLDTVTTSTSPVSDLISISWDASWIGGNASAPVVITDKSLVMKEK